MKCSASCVCACECDRDVWDCCGGCLEEFWKIWLNKCFLFPIFSVPAVRGGARLYVGVLCAWILCLGCSKSECERDCDNFARKSCDSESEVNVNVIAQK